MLKKNKIITVLWEDAKIYHFHKEQKPSLTLTQCRGELVKKNKNFVILKNSQQFVYNKDKNEFILKRKVKFFYVPSGMIVKIIDGQVGPRFC